MSNSDISTLDEYKKITKEMEMILDNIPGSGKAWVSTSKIPYIDKNNEVKGVNLYGYY